jgi:hypothetical protein
MQESNKYQRPGNIRIPPNPVHNRELTVNGTSIKSSVNSVNGVKRVPTGLRQDLLTKVQK